MKLYHWPMSHNARKVRALWRHICLDDVEEVELSMRDKEHETPEFLALNPNGQLPVLQIDDGPIWGANACIYHLALGSELWPDAAPEQSRVIQWMSWQSSDLSPLVVPLHVEQYFKRVRGIPADVERAREFSKKLEAKIGILEGHLSQREWLVGGRLTAADFAVAGDFTHARNARFPLDEAPSVSGWLGRIEALTAWSDTAPPELG